MSDVVTIISHKQAVHLGPNWLLSYFSKQSDQSSELATLMLCTLVSKDKTNPDDLTVLYFHWFGQFLFRWAIRIFHYVKCYPIILFSNIQTSGLLKSISVSRSYTTMVASINSSSDGVPWEGTIGYYIKYVNWQKHIQNQIKHL